MNYLTKIIKLSLFLIFTLSIMTSNLQASKKPTLIFYCGISMVKPMLVISKIIEDKYNCNIKILQGGSKDLYNSLKFSQKGDLYLPGSESYRIDNLKDGYLIDSAYIGFNQAALFVRNGNPKNIKNLDSLLDEDIATILCNPKSGSIGKMTKKLLFKYKGEEFFEDAYDAATEIGTDSRNINRSLIDKQADLAINWRATGSWSENKPYIEVISIDEKYAPKKKLVINLLSFSSHPKIAKALIKFTASKDGQKIMKKFGFR